MIGAIGNIILSFVIGILNIILIPLDLIVDSFIPSLSSAFGYVSNLIDTIISPISLYVLDTFMIPHEVIVLLFEFLIVKYTLPITISGIRYALIWYHNLRI